MEVVEVVYAWYVFQKGFLREPLAASKFWRCHTLTKLFLERYIQFEKEKPGKEPINPEFWTPSHTQKATEPEHSFGYPVPWGG